VVNKYQQQISGPEVLNAETISNSQTSRPTTLNKINSISCQSVIPNNRISINPNTTGILQIYHQNIQGLKWKTDKITYFLYPDLPHVHASRHIGCGTSLEIVSP
jgi:hypothetical protein